MNNKAFYTPMEVASILGCSPHLIRLKARNGELPFNSIIVGNRVKIPKEAFDRFMRGEKND